MTATIRTRFGIVALALLVAFGAAACGKSVGETIDDATITTRVKTSLLNNPQTSGMSIDVDTFKGVVTLSGRVKSQQEAQLAVQTARNTPGVSNVKNALQVIPESQ